MADRRRSMQNHELVAATGVPPAMQLRVAYLLLVAKYNAVVEAATLALGHPVEISLSRVQEIAAQTRATDPRDVVMVKEAPIGDEAPFDKVTIQLATPDEVRAENARIALQAMGARRN